MPKLAGPRLSSMTQEELEALERAGQKGAKKLRESGVTYEQVVREVAAYVHRLRGLRERRQAPRGR